MGWSEHVTLTFHDTSDFTVPARTIYQRTAFRNEAEFDVNNFSAMPSALEAQRPSRSIDNDISVSENYRRMIWQTLEGVYDDSLPETITRVDIRDRVIGEVRDSLLRVFPDLVLIGVGALGGQSGTPGTFYFRKGEAERFLYKNLSAGEKAAFDLILDTVIKREEFNDTVWCIDEPETHLNTRVQATLLETLVDLLPDSCQLWIASHSLGFMSQATERARTRGDVTFLDMGGHDFDQPVTLHPQQPSRAFWTQTLDVALGDVASLVAPSRVVLCEGRPPRDERDVNAEFDASCYRTIFGSAHPETDFLSVGNSRDAQTDRLSFAGALKTLRIATEVVRVRDRDLLSEEEVRLYKEDGVRVLSRRHIEAYLFDDEVLTALCHAQEQSHKVEEVLKAKSAVVTQRVAEGKDADDVKASAGMIYNETRKILQLRNAGSDQRAFARDVLAPLVVPSMAVYQQLEQDIFGHTQDRADDNT